MNIIEIKDYQYYNRLFLRCQFSNLFQTWEYGEVKYKIEDWKVFRFLIMEKDIELGICQVLVKIKYGIFKIIRINRGPIFFNNLNPTRKVELSNSFFSKTLHHLRRKSISFSFITPEIKYNNEKPKLLSLIFKNKFPQFGSSKINLNKSEDELMMSYDGKWRNLLRKAIKFSPKIFKYNNQNDELNEFINFYADFKKKNNFSGVNDETIKLLSEYKNDVFKFNLYFIKKDNNMISGLLSIVHGNTATYLIGISNYEGRKINANYLLLNQAIMDAKSNNCKFFDLGGLNSRTPAGIVRFKNGLNGNNYKLIHTKISPCFSL